MSKLDPSTVLQQNQLFQEYKSSLTENYVALELHNHCLNEIYYWTSEGKAEVDFVITKEQQVFPLEVKSGLSKKKKSLLVYNEKYAKERKITLSRTSLRNFAFEDIIVNYPLYGVSLFPQFLLE